MPFVQQAHGQTGRLESGIDLTINCSQIFKARDRMMIRRSPGSGKFDQLQTISEEVSRNYGSPVPQRMYQLMGRP